MDTIKQILFTSLLVQAVLNPALANNEEGASATNILNSEQAMSKSNECREGLQSHVHAKSCTRSCYRLAKVLESDGSVRQQIHNQCNTDYDKFKLEDSLIANKPTTRKIVIGDVIGTYKKRHRIRALTTKNEDFKKCANSRFNMANPKIRQKLNRIKIGATVKLIGVFYTETASGIKSSCRATDVELIAEP